MPFLSLKEVLAAYLEATLFSACEDNPINFTLPSRKIGLQTPFLPKITLTRPVHWRNIPIQKKPTTGSILYISALPQVISANALELKDATLPEISERLVNQLTQAPLQGLSSDLDHNDDLLTFVSLLWSEFKIETRRPGWLALHLSNKGIDLWIQHHQKVFQTNHKHTQLFLHYGCLSQMSYSLFKSIDQTDRDHNNPAFSEPNQTHSQRTSTRHLKRSFKQPSAGNSISQEEIPSFQPAKDALFDQKAETQLIPAETPSHRRFPSQKASAQQTLRPQQKQLADQWLWQVQYTYARCCTAIQRWEALKANRQPRASLQQALTPAPATLTPAQTTVSIDTSVKETPCPKSSQQPANGLQPSDDRPNQLWNGQASQAQTLIVEQLLSSLIDVVDSLFWIPYRWPSQQYFLLLKGANLLCQAFERFSSHCLVGFEQVASVAEPRNKLGRISPDQGHLQARFDTQFALVIATQSILKVLLEGYLEEPAPTEL